MLWTCPSCGELVRTRDAICPFCDRAGLCPAPRLANVLVLVVAVAAMGGCAMGKSASSDGFVGMDTESTADNDGDGFSPADGDCDDVDDSRSPDAAEATGDGVDSNCDGEDDT